MATVHAVVAKEYKQKIVVELYRDGHKQTEIPKIMKEMGIHVSAGSVSNYISDARKTWREEMVENMEAVLERELNKLDRMEQDAYEAFKKFNPTVTDLNETFDCSNEAIKWMQTMIKIMDQRQNLLGLKKPKKLEVESKNENINVSVESVEALRSQILSRLSPKY